MSTCFEIIPANRSIPNCDELIRYSVALFREFLKKEKITHRIDISVRAVTADNKIVTNPGALVLNEKGYTAFNLNGEGEVYVFFNELTDWDREIWNEEIQENENAQAIREKIEMGLEIGYSWSAKRTMGQPAIVSLYYGYLAIAIAALTDGIIYSDDGAWDWSRLPMEGKAFETEYLDIENIQNATIKENVEGWLGALKE